MIVNWCKTKNFTKQESILLADPKLKTCSNWWITWDVKTNNYSKVLIINVEKYLQPQNGLLLISKLIKYRVECSFFCCTSTYNLVGLMFAFPLCLIIPLLWTTTK